MIHDTGMIEQAQTGHERLARLQDRLSSARRAFSTRRIHLIDATRLIVDNHRPRAGDVILAEVISLGQHRRIENLGGRRGDLYVGDEIIVAYGNRYAPDQFEAYVPDDLGICELVAGGGVAGVVRSRNGRIKAATRIRPIGVLARRSGPINLGDYAGRRAPTPDRRPPVIAVLGSSMNAGKTTTAATLIHGLTRAGFKVGAAKLTGTGSGGDLWSMTDAGAHRVLDFTDAGHASTFGLSGDEVIDVAQQLLDALAAPGIDIAVVEIADGLLQRETAMLLDAAVEAGWFRGVLFAASDAMSAAFGVSLLRAKGLPVVGVSGLVTVSPLASREAEAQTGLPTLGLKTLADPIAVTQIAFQGSNEVGLAA